MAERPLRILLISPKAAQFVRPEEAVQGGEFARFAGGSREIQTIFHFYNGLSAALPTVAALTPPPHELRIIDENLASVDLEEPCDIVGITGMTQQACRAYEIAAEFRKRGRYVVMGGIHATCAPEDAAAHVDTLFVGEAENTWPAFLRDYGAGAPRRLYSQADHPPVELRRSPVPRFELLASYKYPVVWVQGTRGCPRDCEFCAASKIYGLRYRHKDVEQVVQEIREARRHWRLAQIGFADDNMFVHKRHSRRLVEALRGERFTWYAQTDLSVAEDPAMLRALHESGCRILLIGLESASRRALDGLDAGGWKGRMFDHYAQYLARIQEHGIGVYGAFIFGLDGDDAGTIDRTIEFVQANNLMGAQVTILTPFPGSRLRLRLEAEGRILHSDWRWYTAWNPVIRPPALSFEDMEQGLVRFYRSVYNRDSYLRRNRHFRAICERLVRQQAG